VMDAFYLIMPLWFWSDERSRSTFHRVQWVHFTYDVDKFI